MSGERVLLADDDLLARDFLAQGLAALELEVRTAADGEAAASLLAQESFDFVVTDLRMPRRDGLFVLETAKRQDPDRPVVLVTAHGTVGVAVEAVRLGADDVLEKPLSIEQLELAVHRLRARRKLLTENRRLKAQSEAGEELLVLSDAMRDVVSQVEKVARNKATVLLRGRSGTGKELVAALVHRRSDRARLAHVKVNCAAIPAELLESEFFGHERGAFTGATARREGRFEQADQGTLFLDEVTEIALPLQAKLLRVLQEGEFTRVGGSQLIKVDVRVVAATNRDLEAEVAAGRFREDLFFRLNVVPITIPPLCERSEEIVPLAEHFLRASDPRARLHDGASELLRRHAWPGNVRELRNLMQRAALLAPAGLVDADLLGPWLGAIVRPAPAAGDPLDALVGRTLVEVEQQLIERTLRQCGGNRTRTAEMLGISVRTLFNKLREPALR
jgi:two-component system response regulator AtoC